MTHLAPPFCITLTGADDQTELRELWAASRDEPAVEWGILHSPTRQGAGRYPSERWLDALCEHIECHPGPRFSLHLCGRAVDDLLAGDFRALARIRPFPRVQLNARFDAARGAVLRDLLRLFPSKSFITQHNEANADLHRQLAGLPNHQVLFDASGGRGLLPTQWLPPLRAGNEVIVCGYAGGLGPENLQRHLPEIARTAAGELYWADMESSLRTVDDTFHVGLARLALREARRALAPGFGSGLAAHAEAAR